MVLCERGWRDPADPPSVGVDRDSLYNFRQILGGLLDQGSLRRGEIVGELVEGIPFSVRDLAVVGWSNGLGEFGWYRNGEDRLQFPGTDEMGLYQRERFLRGFPPGLLPQLSKSSAG